MGSLISPTVVNLFMEHFVVRAINRSPNPQPDSGEGMWMIPLSSKKTLRDEFQEHINSMEPHIQCSTVEIRSDGSMPFIDTLVTPEQDRILSTTIYGKPTHTD